MPIAADQDQLIELAVRAKDYARDKILHGTTQLENNNLAFTQVEQISASLTEIRKQTFELSDSLFSLEDDGVISRYELQVDLSAKYSLGNCYELSLLALDYILQDPNNENIDAEACRINGGDHVFLLIGRAPGSDILNPDKWGEKAIICDPWANKVYPAAMYKEELKNVYQTYDASKQHYQVHLEDFDSNKHQICSLYRLNTKDLTSAQNAYKLRVNFQTKLNNTITVVKSYQEKLLQLKQQIISQHGTKDLKAAIIDSKLQALDQEIKNLTNLSNNPPLGKNYRDTKQTLESQLKKAVFSASKVMKFSESDVSQLFDYRNKDKLKTKFMMFFKIKPKTIRELQNIAKETNKSIKKI